MENSPSSDPPFVPTIWEAFHDGSIDRITGDAPGAVQFEVAIEYLRERIPEAGEYFFIRFSNCKSLRYRRYDGEFESKDLKAITKIAPTILSAEMKGSVCHVFGDDGVLEIEATGPSLSLDSGREMELAELLQVATDYWKEWETKPDRDD